MISVKIMKNPSKDLMHVIDLYKTPNKSTHVPKKYPIEYQELCELTSFLPESASTRQRFWHIEQNQYSIPLCKHCGKNPVKWHRVQYATTCSSHCATSHTPRKEKYIKTLQEKYGGEITNMSQISDVKIKKKITTQKHYGVDNISQALEIKQKKIDTHYNSTGFDHPMQNPETRKKSMNTCMDVYGVKNPAQNQDVIQRGKETSFKRYNRIHYLQQHISDEILNKLTDYDYMYDLHITQQKSMLEISNMLNVGDLLIARYLRKLDIEPQTFTISSQEREIVNYIKSIYTAAIQTNIRNLISPYELDIYIPEHKLAIEFNGLYWHSEIYKDKNYHLDKMNKCNDLGIKLLHIFEDDWTYKQDIVKSKLRQLLGLNKDKVFARKTHVVIPTKNQKQDFYNTYHIQGTTSSSIDIGLEYDDKLVACMSFKKRKSGAFELVRYATSTNVVGGFSKLLKYFRVNYHYTELVSFADLSWSQGDLYEKTGWILDKQLSPDYMYVIGDQRKHKFGFRHKQLKNILENYEPTLSEHQNMMNHNIYRIYNCGLLRYTYKPEL